MAAPSLEERLRRLEDLEALRDLMARYAFHINKGWKGKTVHVEAMRSIFATDARWESKAMGLAAEGLDDIMVKLAEATARTEFSMHSFTNPIIEIAGDRAEANWLMWIASRRDGGPPNQVFMSEDLTYARTPDGWRIKTAELHFGMALNIQVH